MFEAIKKHLKKHLKCKSDCPSIFLIYFLQRENEALQIM